jgi:hypothetical protein
MAMELTEVGRLSGRIMDEVERAVVGKREALELLLLGEDAHGTLVRARDLARLLPHPVHTRPDAV